MSFTARTKILAASGVAVPISRLRPGDKVLSTNTRTGKTQAEPVAAVLVHHDSDRYNLSVKNAHGSAVIQTTSSHLFFDQTIRRWATAGTIKYGDRLHTRDGSTITVIGGRIPANASGWMWDLSVPGGGDHDFYVDVINIGILVHNCPVPRDNGYAWPDNGGFEGPSVKMSLPNGYQFDRYGGIPEEDSGRFASPSGTPFEMRSLPKGNVSRPFTTYAVAVPFEAEVGIVRPWGGMPGGGFQIYFPNSISDLLKMGFIRAVP